MPGLALAVAAFVSPAVAQRIPPPTPTVFSGLSAEQIAQLEHHGPGPRPKPDWLPALNERWDALRQEGVYGVDRYNAEVAARIIDELYYDWGDAWSEPGANNLWQESILQQIERWPRADDQTAAILRDGLLDYYYAGGFQNGPYQMTDLAEAILAWADEDDFESIDVGHHLLDDAQAWAAQAGRDYLLTVITDDQDKYFGSDGRFADTEGDPLRDDAMPADDAGRYRRFRRLIYEVRRDRQPTADSLAELSQSLRDVLAHPGSAAIPPDAIMRICKLYTQMLKRSHGVPPEVVAAIDADLLWLARDSRALASERLWQTWGRPAAALGQRASEGMREFAASPPDATPSPADSTDTPAGHPHPPRDEALLRARARVLAKVAEAIGP